MPERREIGSAEARGLIAMVVERLEAAVAEAGLVWPGDLLPG